MFRKEIEIEKATSREKGQPLCMSQYYRLMTSYRIPGRECDSLMNTEEAGSNPDQHIIIACRNKVFFLFIYYMIHMNIFGEVFHSIS